MKTIHLLFTFCIALFVFCSCSKETNSVNAAGDAEFTLAAAGDSCTGFVLTGNYIQGVAMTNANTATASVNVTAAGAYSITTNTANGVSFSGSGTFSSTGAQTVVLTASGLPTTGGSFNYDLVGGSTGCSISVIYNSTSGNIISCSIDGGPITNFPQCLGAYLNEAPAPQTSLDIQGQIALGDTENIYINLTNISGVPISPGTYDVNMGSTGMFVSMIYRDANLTDYYSPPTGVPQAPPLVTVTISSMTSGPNPRITGTFSGPLRELNGSGVKMISNGVFDLALH